MKIIKENLGLLFSRKTANKPSAFTNPANHSQNSEDNLPDEQTGWEGGGTKPPPCS